MIHSEGWLECVQRFNLVDAVPMVLVEASSPDELNGDETSSVCVLTGLLEVFLSCSKR